MTDKEKLDKVVAEIERLKSQWQNGCSSEAKYRLEMLNDVLDFINSMQEEPTFNVGDRVGTDWGEGIRNTNFTN